ncbi:MAG TPA: GNAT family N-acetyltransferase [Candidatus Acidoferrales bacterium]|nr:GNAT family N-acetyltransferase [Candidatus Acidoferrales bacterium]
MLFRTDGRVVGMAQVLSRQLPWVGRVLAWVNRGPLCLGESEEMPATLRGMLEVLRKRYVGSQGAYLRVAAPVLRDSHEADWVDLPGFACSLRPGWASSLIDLSQPVEALRRNLDKKWRNCLAKAERLRLRVDCQTDRGALDGFASRYGCFVKARNLSTRVTPELVRLLGRALPDAPPLVIVSSSNGTHLGSILVVRYADRAEYLAAVIDEAGRAMNVGQLLLWRAITELKSVCRWFDVGGMHPELTPAGIFHFKEGLGGVAYRYANEIDAHGSLVSRLLRGVCNCARI